LSGDPPFDPPILEAQEAVRVIGTNALPFLLSWIIAEDSWFRKKLIQFDNGQTKINLHLKPAATKAIEAAYGFMALAELGEPAASDLSGIVLGANEEASDLAVSVLPYLGSAGVESVIELLSSTNAVTRRRAALTLCSPLLGGAHQDRYAGFTERYRRRSAEAVPALIRLLSDNDTNVAYAATFALRTLSARPEEVIPALTNLAASAAAPPNVRGGAIVAVGTYGSAARSVIPFLQTFTNDANSRFRGAASNALWRIAGGPPKGVKTKPTE
jgi:hypothetical protein